MVDKAWTRLRPHNGWRAAPRQCIECTLPQVLRRFQQNRLLVNPEQLGGRASDVSGRCAKVPEQLPRS